jgi:hypothetical protein
MLTKNFFKIKLAKPVPIAVGEYTEKKPKKVLVSKPIIDIQIYLMHTPNKATRIILIKRVGVIFLILSIIEL